MSNGKLYLVRHGETAANAERLWQGGQGDDPLNERGRAQSMAAAQALDLREFNPGKGVQRAHEVIRKYVDYLDIDRPLYPDHTRMKELVESCEILKTVEETIGSLG